MRFLMVLTVLLLAAGCRGGAQDLADPGRETVESPPPVEYQLASIDGIADPSAADLDRYRGLLDQATANCGGARQSAADYATRSQQILSDDGVKASLEEILRQVSFVTNAREAGMDCRALFSAVVVMMEQRR
jgi:hypothetical protein